MREDGTKAGSIWRTAILVFAVLATYASALDGPFIFDDSAAIVDNGSIRDLRSGAVLSADREVPTAGRPVVNLSLALNYAAGGLSTRGYHLTNIALHTLCTLLVFALLTETLRRDGFAGFVGANALNLAFAVALLWAVHPLNSEVVNYTTQRTESMMTLCYLVTIYAAVRAFDAKGRGAWNLAAVVACAVGMGCKESMVTAPVLVAIFDRVFLFSTWRRAWARRWRLYGGLAATWLVLIAATWSGPRIHSAGFASGVTPWTYLLNQSVMIVQYLRLALWPQGLVLHYGEPLSVTMTDVLPASLFVVALLAGTVFALVRFPAIGFFGAWFFVTLAPTTTIIPIATEVGAERRLYLPLVAVLALLVLAVTWFMRTALTRSALSAALRKRAELVAATAAIAVASTTLAARTVVRNREYQSSLIMAQTVCDRWPTPVAHAMLGVELEAAGRHGEAVEHLEQSAAGGYSRAHYHLGGALFNHQQKNESIRELLLFLAQSPELVEAVKARMLLARAYADERQWPLATEQLRQVLVMRPSNVDAIGLLADALFAQQQPVEAIALYRVFISHRPTDVGALINLGVAYAGLGRTDEAKATFQTGLQVDPRDVRVSRNLAALALNMGDAEGGRRAAQQAIAAAPGDAESHDLLGRALAMQGRLAEARIEFERALALDPAFDQARADLALVAGAK